MFVLASSSQQPWNDRHSGLEPTLQIRRLRPSRVTSWPTQLANHSLMLCFPSPSSVYGSFAMCCLPEGQSNSWLHVPKKAGTTLPQSIFRTKISPREGLGGGHCVLLRGSSSHQEKLQPGSESGVIRAAAFVLYTKP